MAGIKDMLCKAPRRATFSQNLTRRSQNVVYKDATAQGLFRFPFAHSHTGLLERSAQDIAQAGPAVS